MSNGQAGNQVLAVRARRVLPWLTPALALALLISVFVGTSEQSEAHSQEREDAALVVSELERETAEEVADTAATVSEANLEQIGSMRPERLTADADVIRSLLEIALTWSSDLEYSEAREAIERRFGLSPDAQFLTEFMPPSLYSVDGEGNVYYYLDARGLNSRLGQYTINPVSLEGTVYRYIVIVNSSSLSPDGRGSASLPIIMTATVDADGTLSDLSAQSTNQKPRTAGEVVEAAAS